MYRSPLAQLPPGAVLAKTIYDDAGRVLLTAGTELRGVYVRALERRGILTVYVRDGLADDVVPQQVVSEAVRTTIAGHVSQTFDQISLLASERGAGRGGHDGIVEALGEEPLRFEENDETIAQLYSDVERLIAEVLRTDTVEDLESLKTHSEYTFQHSVDVAVIGILLGRQVDMPLDRMRELALGCLLHDLGKIYVDQLILDKPGALTAAEIEAMQRHPELGFELIRRMPFRSLLPAHVAYQHHERQNGSGYPRGLIGDNTIGARTYHERLGTGRMLLIAEIAAVADVYSALTSDRPYRDAMPSDKVADLLQRMSTGHLNREIVTRLRRIVPRFPVGTWVDVATGPRAGWRGVVIAVHGGQMDRPTVRLLLDPRLEAVADPPEIDTRDVPEMGLRSAPAGQEPTAGPSFAAVAGL